MFTFSLKSTICALLRPRKEIIEWHKFKTGEARNRKKGKPGALQHGPSHFWKVYNIELWLYVSVYQTVRYISVPQTSQKWAHRVKSDTKQSPNSMWSIFHPCLLTETRTVMQINDPLYLYWWLQFKHFQCGHGPRDHLGHSNIKLRS